LAQAVCPLCTCSKKQVLFRHLSWYPRLPDVLLMADPDAVVETFPIDVDIVIEELTKKLVLGKLCLWAWPCLICTIPAFFLYEQKNMDVRVKSIKLYITSENIKYEEGPYFTGCRCDACGKQGKISRAVPFDRVQDVLLEEPAGNYCCCFPEKLDRTQVQTAGSDGAEMTIQGLKDGKHFKEVVLDMKRKGKMVGVGPGAVAPSVLGAPGQVTMDSGAWTKEAVDEHLSLLREQVQLLKAMKSSV